MTFSVVIPTRRRDDLLALCLEDLRCGGHEAQVIVTDDGASESTRTLVADRFPGVRWTAGPQRGPAANRNHGASLATGDFIVFIDDDVRPGRGLLAAYARAIGPEVNVYEGRTTCKQGLHSPWDVSPVNETGGWLWSCNMMVRTSFLRSFGGFDEDFRFPHMEDVAFRARLKAAGQRFLFVPEAVVDHPPRRRPPAASRLPIHESVFIYSYKYLGRAPSLRELIWQDWHITLRGIVSRPLGIDSLTALGSMFVEEWGIIRRWRDWDRRFRALRGGATARRGAGDDTTTGPAGSLDSPRRTENL